MSFAKWWPLCAGLNVYIKFYDSITDTKLIPTQPMNHHNTVLGESLYNKAQYNMKFHKAR